MAIALSELDSNEILFDFNGVTNARPPVRQFSKIQLGRTPIPIAQYRARFDKVMQALLYGDSFLANLTVRTQVTTPLSLQEIFYNTSAKYRLWYRDAFVVFSPEIFVQIRDRKIYSFPMKGTIDAAVPHAREKILSDKKETAEHVTIVDLIRNDLSRVASRVRVNRFRYIDELTTSEKKLLQVSSEIAGELPADFLSRLGEILVTLLPAGSVSGAPKEETLRVLKAAEGEKRGYYTGVAGIFDGRSLDAGVMIRFIESDNGSLFYRSGGGITTQSIVENEFNEVIDKVYVPFD